MEINFADAANQAKEMVNTPAPEAVSSPATPTPTTTSTQPVGTQTPVAGGQTPSPQSTPAATPATPGQVNAEPTFDVDLGNGRVEKLTQTQLKEYYLNGLRQADYTRKTQEIAAQRAQLEQYAQAMLAREQQLQQQFNPQQGVPQQIAPNVDLNQPLTLAQLQPILQNMQMQAQQQALLVQQYAQQYVNDTIQTANHAEKFNGTLAELKKEYPVLNSRQEFEDVIRYNVAKLNPQSEEEAINFFKQAAKELNDSILSSVSAQQQQLNSQRAAMVAQATEPPGGAAPAIEKPSFKKPNGDLDWAKMAQAAVGLANGN